ncbi:DNA polymerase III subunit alpha [Pseudolactococcus insecticola]|uniref:DNA polymerase III subunit alpha n=1 Tax=Pseudolactococcus insecticola TaxID=2709158 RepID=A0A6A0B4K3_9LACT|nr:DNA polymerase III subunit alpha [Lactococcus insecticola]GFH40112.1 DNA polymerase III subunit alpha [Lactococcus insecticola]
MPDYAQINTKTVFSFMDATVKISDYVAAGKRMGYKTLGISDVENLHAVHQFITASQVAGIQPIVAFESAFLVDNLFVKLHFIAKSTLGLQNLYRISSRKNFGAASDSTTSPTFSDIASHLTDVAIVIDSSQAMPTILEKLPKNDVYIGLSEMGQKISSSSNSRPTIPFLAVRYLNTYDAETLAILRHIRQGTKYDESLMVSHHEILRAASDVTAVFDAQSLKNLDQLVSGINYTFDTQLDLPRFNKEKPAVDELREIAERFLRTKNLTGQAYQKRLAHELSVIHQMGFDDYFLIVSDVLRYARSEQIYTGMGRGSSLGSLVAYALEITGVDPVENDLLFERFLNPERASLPDIDIDMPDNKRADILTYVKNRYGSSHVAQIMTFSTFGMKQSFRDVAKVFGMTEIEISQVSGTIGRSDNLAQEYEKNNKFRAAIINDKRLQQVFSYAQKIEGMPRQKSVHASGVVLAANDLTDYLPLAPGDTLPITQFEAHDVEAIGLIKFDFLSIKNLTFINDMRDLVEKRYDKKIDISQIDLNDAETLAIFRAGRTLGIFQFENPQMMNFLRQLQPTAFTDVVAATSIFRPGPSAFIPEFIRRRHGEETVTYPDPSIAAILAPTYGIMIYQEQIMQVAQVFAGFSLGRADLLRRAISKKKGDEFEQLKAEFVSGSLAQGHTAQKAIEIYELIERFANYGFNRSHAFGYGALAVQMTYFKAHYPDAFYEIMLRDSKRVLLLNDAQQSGFRLAKLSVNRMPYFDKLNDGQIFIGMRAIKGLPRDFVFWVIEHRPFTSLQDFIQKLPENYQKSALIRPLIEIGTFDEFDQNRRKLVDNLAKLLEFTTVFQTDLFSETAPALTFAYTDAEDYSPVLKYQLEFDLLGVAVTEHPLMSIAKKRQGNFTEIANLAVNQRATILVELGHIKTHRAKNGANMAFLTVTDTHNQLDITLFPETYHRFLPDLAENDFYLMTGKVSERNERLQMVADQLVKVEETDRKLWLAVLDTAKNAKIAQILKDFPGNQAVVLYNEATKTTQLTGIYVAESELLLKRLAGYVDKAVFR